MVGLARVEERFTTILKDFRDTDRSRYYKEVEAYTNLDWATPKLIVHNEFWIEVERCTPILNLGPERSRKYREPLRDLLQAVHEAGYWHADTDLTNIVVHPSRGVLIIDWENLSPASGSVSYDLYGARAAGAQPPWKHKGPDGVWWGYDAPTSPKGWWGR